MENRVGTIAATQDPNFGEKPPAAKPPQGKPADAEPQTPDPADMRLVIEQDKASGSYVYKTVDRRTGHVLLQLPREQLLRLRDKEDYAAGDVIRAKA